MSDWQKSTAVEFRHLLTELGQRRVPSNLDGFDEEFEVLRNVDTRVKGNPDEFYNASLGSNMCKNRYHDVLPNEGTRVTLVPTTVRGDGGDYVNANYIDGRRLFGVPFVYIATQAPIRATLVDFWRMVWENNSAFIAMLCKEVEGGKNKSFRYFPDTVGSHLTCGPLMVLLESENRREESVFRRILLRSEDGKERRVFHMQHMTWPDQSIPKSSAGLMDMVYALGKSALSTQTPIVVHCSGGIGRTGVFIALHVALGLYQMERPISIPRIVQYLKYCRTGMVQRKDQYLFLYYAVLREMEKMVWAFENKGSATFKAAMVNQQLDRSNQSVARRANEYASKNAASSLHQGPPMMERSALFPTRAMGYADKAADHHIVSDSRDGQYHMPPKGVHSNEAPHQRQELDDLLQGRSAHSRLRGHQQQFHTDADAYLQGVDEGEGEQTSQEREAEQPRVYDRRSESTPSAPKHNMTHLAIPMNPIQEQLALLQEQNQRRRGTAATPGSATRGISAAAQNRPPVLHKAVPKVDPLFTSAPSSRSTFREESASTYGAVASSTVTPQPQMPPKAPSEEAKHDDVVESVKTPVLPASPRSKLVARLVTKPSELSVAAPPQPAFESTSSVPSPKRSQKYFFTPEDEADEPIVTSQQESISNVRRHDKALL